MKKHKMRSGAGGHHTGPIHHKTGMHLQSVSGRDPHASAEHHAANVAQGMHDGFHPDEGYEEGPSNPEGNTECCM